MQAIQQQKLMFFDTGVSDEDILDRFPDYELWYSRKAIADALGVSKSPTLIAKLESLVQRGYLERSLFPLPNRVDMVAYKLLQRDDNV